MEKASTQMQNNEHENFNDLQSSHFEKKPNTLSKRYKLFLVYSMNIIVIAPGLNTYFLFLLFDT